jgi:formylmethanofuran dehydrogenase subunit E
MTGAQKGDAMEDSRWTVKPIGWVRNSVQYVPRSTVADFKGVDSEIEILEEFSPALDGIEGFSHLSVLYWMHRLESLPGPLKVHPAGLKDLPLVGLLATRSPRRPNPIGLTTVRLLSIQGNRLRVGGLDALDGSPVIDIKPYFPIDPANLRLPDWARRWDRREGAREKRSNEAEIRRGRPQIAEPTEPEKGGVMTMPGGPRAEIEGLIARGDLHGLLLKAGELHGHLCSYLTLGLKAGCVAVRELAAKSTGMEEVVAIVETNNCFSDGVQMATGCSFGNNALVFRDIGKTAFTLARRDGQSVRVTLKPGHQERFGDRFPDASTLFDKLVRRREEPAPGESERMMQIWREISFAYIDVPEEELFQVEHRVTQLPSYAPIFASAKCSECGEDVMESRLRVKDGQPICMDCAAVEQFVLDGSGMALRIWD